MQRSTSRRCRIPCDYNQTFGFRISPIINFFFSKSVGRPLPPPRLKVSVRSVRSYTFHALAVDHFRKDPAAADSYAHYARSVHTVDGGRAVRRPYGDRGDGGGRAGGGNAVAVCTDSTPVSAPCRRVWDGGGHKLSVRWWLRSVGRTVNSRRQRC